MKRVVVDHFGGPEVLRVVEDDDPRPGPGEVCVRVLAAGVSFTDAQLRAGTYLGVPKPPFTPGYELVGIVEELGPGCSRLRVGDRIGALTVWGADAERVCVPEAEAVEVPGNVDPAEVLNLVFTYMTAYQLLHRVARVRSGETVLVHGAAGRVGTAVLELGAAAGLTMYGTASARDRAPVERLGAVAIDYRNEDFLERVRRLPGRGVDVVLDGLGGALSLRSFRALRPGGRLVVYGHYATLEHGHKNWRAWAEWYAATGAVGLWSLLPRHRQVRAYRIQKLHGRHRQLVPVAGGHPALAVGGGPRDPDQYRADFRALLELLREHKIHPVVAERLPLSEARRAPGVRVRAAGLGRAEGRPHAAVRGPPSARDARALGGEGKARARAIRRRPRPAEEDAQMVRDGPTGAAEEAVSGGARQASRARYLPIAEHGLIGDMHTAALVGTNGTIDWYCCPRFDSPSVFGAILDADRGGAFRIAPDCDGWTSKQLYLPDTAILITRFLMPGGVGEVQDFMPPPRTGEAAHRHRMIRRVLAVRGQMRFVVDVVPRFDYARARHEVELTPYGAFFRSPELQLSLATRHPLQIVGDRDIRGRVALRAGETATFVLDRIQPGERQVPYSDADVAAEFDATVAFWRHWLRGSRYSGRWRETVHRSALTLKLLTFAPTGAIVAAPTTSLPEELGGARNWDYRYTWMRDAAFSLYALLRLGFTEEAGAFMEWLEQRFRHAADYGESGPLQIMYGIDGREELPEEEFGHLEGYMGSAPVRIGNRAATQLQLDIYGELMDSVYLCNKYGRPLYHDGWMELTRNVEWLMDHWDQPDEGVWETRGGRRDYTYSRLMSWVAVERAVRIARQRGLPADLPHWTAVRDTIYSQIMKRGWNSARQAFVQHYDTDVLDASLLIMPLCKFVAPIDPRWISTLDAITAELVSDSLVYRYNVEASPDGLAGTEATFSMCSFWWVEALARAGRLDEARLAFEKMLTYANHVGLYAEEIGPTGDQLGNFPQAFTHLALISAAYNLDRRIG